jgi:hypothetical protein
MMSGFEAAISALSALTFSGSISASVDTDVVSVDVFQLPQALSEHGSSGALTCHRTTMRGALLSSQADLWQ